MEHGREESSTERAAFTHLQPRLYYAALPTFQLSLPRDVSFKLNRLITSPYFLHSIPHYLKYLFSSLTFLKVTQDFCPLVPLGTVPDTKYRYVK